ncbi:MAG: acyl-CoA dehydrogenase family protein [candidate division WOR-3 bacterium]|nr:acyl-CoA dehydrogenase family protein [candidate division WOR-3 bacterium]MDW7987570.1 acyl-CoA dehydrogenase family protein [candidate division WOR-3 bacterium]
MIDFSFTEEQLMIQKLARDFAQKEVAPRIKELDEKAEFDRSILTKMAELGLLGLTIPTKYGGSGGDYISLGLACEELEYVDTSLRVILSVHIGLNSLTLLSWGTEEQKQKYLVPQAQGKKIATFGLTEPNAGSDVVAIEARAQRDGDYWIINGEKMWISLADVADNFLIFAWTDPEKRKKRDHSGISCFIVERSFPGVSTATIHGKLGIRAGNTGSISLSDVRVPKENMLGQEGEGFKIAMFALDQGRYTVAAGATGLIRACLDYSVKYANERKTFGEVIGKHQLVKEMITEMVVGYECSRLLWLKAGWCKNKGLRSTRETSLAKMYACDASERAASHAVQIYGAYGYSNEYPVERFYRNAKGAVIYEGSREIHKIMQADYALGYRVDKPTRCTLPTPEE